MKAELFSSDFIVSIIIFLSILVILGMYYGNLQADIYEKNIRNDMHIKAVNTASLLAISSGDPEFWNSSNVRVIGLYDSERFNRNIGVWSEKFQESLKDVTIGIAGLGGSGGGLATILARNGFYNFKLADFDKFERHNIQRQFYALESTLNKPKSDITAQGIKDINPEVSVEVYEKGVTLDNLDHFLDNPVFSGRDPGAGFELTSFIQRNAK